MSHREAGQGVDAVFLAVKAARALATLLLCNRAMPLEQVMQRIRLEYEELPGLRLTRWQAQRLWQLDPRQCESVLTSLVRSTFLTETREGTFVRREHQPPLSAVR